MPDASPGSVGRAMRGLGLSGVRRAKGIRTTIPAKDGKRAGDLLDRDFTAAAPNTKWVMDFIYCRTWAGFVYLAFIVDVFAQKIVSWHAATSKDTDLVMIPLRMVLWQRDREGKPVATGKLIAHSDAGSQYTSIRFTGHLELEDIRPSIGSVGDAYDNALMETVIGLFKTECIRTTVFHDQPFKTIADIEFATAGWVDWYNNRRLHSSIGYVQPVEYETTHYATLNPYRSGRKSGTLHFSTSHLFCRFHNPLPLPQLYVWIYVWGMVDLGRLRADWLNKQEPGSGIELATALEQVAEVGEAAEIYRKVGELGDPRGYEGLAWIERQQGGSVKDAIALMTKAANAYPAGSDNRAYCLGVIGHWRWHIFNETAAEAQLREGLVHYESARADLAELLKVTDRVTESIEILREGVRNEEKGSFLPLANILAEQGHISEAITLYKQGYDLGDAYCAFNLGLLLDEYGNNDEAQAWMHKAAQRGDELATIWLTEQNNPI